MGFALQAIGKMGRENAYGWGQRLAGGWLDFEDFRCRSIRAERPPGERNLAEGKKCIIFLLTTEHIGANLLGARAIGCASALRRIV